MELGWDTDPKPNYLRINITHVNFSPSMGRNWLCNSMGGNWLCKTLNVSSIQIAMWFKIERNKRMQPSKVNFFSILQWRLLFSKSNTPSLSSVILGKKSTTLIVITSSFRPPSSNIQSGMCIEKWCCHCHGTVHQFCFPDKRCMNLPEQGSFFNDNMWQEPKGFKANIQTCHLIVHQPALVTLINLLSLFPRF